MIAEKVQGGARVVRNIGTWIDYHVQSLQEDFNKLRKRERFGAALGAFALSTGIILASAAATLELAQGNRPAWTQGFEDIDPQDAKTLFLSSPYASDKDSHHSNKAKGWTDERKVTPTHNAKQKPSALASTSASPDASPGGLPGASASGSASPSSSGTPTTSTSPTGEASPSPTDTSGDSSSPNAPSQSPSDPAETNAPAMTPSTTMQTMTATMSFSPSVS